MASPQMVNPQVATPSIPVNIGAELGLDETTEPEAEPEVAGAATNQTAAENKDRQGNMAGSMINVPGMGQTAHMPGQMTGQMGQMSGQSGQMGQMPGQMGQMGQMANQMGQMFGQMGQLGQMGGQMASMLRRQGGHQNQFMGGIGGMVNQYNPYPQNSMWPQHSMGGQSAMGQNSMAGNVGSKPIPFSMWNMNQQTQMGGQNNWGQMNQNPLSGLGQNSMGATGMFGQNAQNSMAGQSVQVHQPSHYGTQYNSAMPVMASASISQDSSFDSIKNERKKK